MVYYKDIYMELWLFSSGDQSNQEVDQLTFAKHKNAVVTFIPTGEESLGYYSEFCQRMKPFETKNAILSVKRKWGAKDVKRLLNSDIVYFSGVLPYYEVAYVICWITLDLKLPLFLFILCLYTIDLFG